MQQLETEEIQMRTILKFVVPAIQGLVTVFALIWYTANWKERVDHRLDDIDRDLKAIHEHYEKERPVLPLYPLTSLDSARENTVDAASH